MNQKALNIATVAAGVLTTVTKGRTIYQATANAMDSVEIQGTLTGLKKKEAVMAFIKGLVINLGTNWDVYEELISTFIDQIKTAYNAVKDLFK
ncbi:hypothetical protein D7V21_16775 [Acinetobacter guerrae]|uniref:Uncharacterized protein n=1 Tax=Acinetobacter guerrae TaxID=1843371 RepID=A0A3A8EM37_9GAMM|nr:hypothetical protein [Acinetobacter guerrae]RKG29921.1 hypothetical protein D7V21_16775 [Acinetobacter guerrae]